MYSEFEEMTSDENFELGKTMGALIDFEVGKRMEENLAHYEHVKKELDKVKKENIKLLSDFNKLKKEYKSIEDNAVKLGKKQVLREIIGGYKLGDEVWFVQPKYLKHNCVKCNKTSKVEVEFEGEMIKVSCPKCKGNGYKYRYEYIPTKGIITEIKYHTWHNDENLQHEVYISYDKKKDTAKRELGQFFKTEEEAKASSERLSLIEDGRMLKTYGEIPMT